MGTGPIYLQENRIYGSTSLKMRRKENIFFYFCHFFQKGRKIESDRFLPQPVFILQLCSFLFVVLRLRHFIQYLIARQQQHRKHQVSPSPAFAVRRTEVCISTKSSSVEMKKHFANTSPPATKDGWGCWSLAASVCFILCIHCSSREK